MGKNFFDEKVKLQIKEQISIIEIAKEYGLTPVRKGNHYSLEEHDSVVIYPESNTFFRHKSSVGGDIFAFMQEIPEINVGFKDVYLEMSKRIDRSKEPVPMEDRPAKPKTIFSKQTNTFNINESLNQCEDRERKLLSKVAIEPVNKNVKAYLIQTRCINPDVVDDFISKGLVKQEKGIKGYRNALFIGYNDVGYITAICKKSCSSHGKFKGDVEGSNYAYGWRYDPDIKNYKELYKTEFYDSSKPLICFEGYIDMMAYISTLKEKNIDIHKYSYIACGSTTKYQSVVCAVKNNYYSEVICAFDNDEAGDLHSMILAREIQKEIGDDIIVTRQKSYLKDWDEDRIAISQNDPKIMTLMKAKDNQEMPHLKEQYDCFLKTENSSKKKTLICFQGRIDMMAYINELKAKEKDIGEYFYISCPSQNHDNVVSVIRDYDFKKVVCAFNNDEIGENKAILLARTVQKELGDDISFSREYVDKDEISKVKEALKNKRVSIGERANQAKKELKPSIKKPEKNLAIGH